jgi:hypothetical protein
MSSFQLHHRHLPDTELSSRHGTNEQDFECDLIAFLGIIQAMEIDILPITWQPELNLAGEGGTSAVTQSMVNLQTSFAFKCISESQKRRLQEGKISEANIFQTFINEIVILGHPRLREHTNINQLQGICWDISAEDKVWPVLISEKTQFEDLYHFLQLPVGRDLSITDRLKFCIDVGTAIIDMKSLGKIMIPLPLPATVEG